MGLDSFGDEELDKEFRAYVEFLSIRIPADWIVPPFALISASLIAWIDSRQLERKEAVEIHLLESGTDIRLDQSAIRDSQSAIPRDFPWPPEGTN